MNHDNCPNCQPGQSCREHRVIGDGQGVRVHLTMMDGMQRALHDRLHGSERPAIPDEVRIQARIDHAVQLAQQDGAPELDPRTREVLDAKGRQVITQLREIADTSARIQAHVDHYAEQNAARAAAIRANPREAAYQAMCDDLDFFSCQRG